MKWTRNFIFFEYFVFVIWKIVIKDEKPIKKKRAVIDIKKLNKIVVSDVYFMSTQIDITAAVADCKYISVIDAMKYFHQWKIKLENRYKQTIISHKNQKQFNVIVMNFKNSFVYVQRQTNLLLKNMRKFVRTFIDDIIIFSRIREKHLKHFEAVFERLFFYDVIFSAAKVFLDFSSLILLNQIMNALKLITAKKKLAAIIQLTFFRTLNAFEVYLKLIEWMRNYVSYYAQIIESLQNCKTIFLKKKSIKNNFKKTFSKKNIYRSADQCEISVIWISTNQIQQIKLFDSFWSDEINVYWRWRLKEKKFRNHDFSCSSWFRRERHCHHQKRNSIYYVF